MRTLAPPILAAAALLAASCSSGEPQDAPSSAVVSEQEQQEMVEEAIRRSYAQEGVEVVEIRMERSADGSAFVGPATVRNPQTGYEMRVDCRYTRTVADEPSLECSRAAPEEDAGTGTG